MYIHAFRPIAVLGLRRGELAALQTARDYDGQTLTVRESINSLGEVTRGKTDNARRSIRLPEIARDVIADSARMLTENGVKSRYMTPIRTARR